MRHFTAPLALLAGALLPAAAAHAAEGSFRIVNTYSSASIQRVWTAPAISGTVWNEVFLNQAILPGTNSTFTFATANYCLVDVKVRFSDLYEQTFGQVNICRGDYAVAS